MIQDSSNDDNGDGRHGDEDVGGHHGEADAGGRHGDEDAGGDSVDESEVQCAWFVVGHSVMVLALLG